MHIYQPVPWELQQHLDSNVFSCVISFAFFFWTHIFLLCPAIDIFNLLRGVHQELPWMPGTLAATWLRGSGPYLRAVMKLPGWWHAWWNGPARTSTVTHTGALIAVSLYVCLSRAISLLPLYKEVVHFITALQYLLKIAFQGRKMEGWEIFM